MNCNTCNIEFLPNKSTQKYCCLKCKNRSTNNKHLNYKAQQERGLKNRLTLIKLKGNKCSECDYNKNIAALCFHHRDKSTKNFQIDLRKCSNTKFEILLEEVEKCDLLCHNCHMELHNPDLTGLIT